MPSTNFNRSAYVFRYPIVKDPQWRGYTIMSQDPGPPNNHSDEARDVLAPLPQERRAASDAPNQTAFSGVWPQRNAYSESSPIKSDMQSATVSNAGYMDPDVKAYLKQHFRGSVIRNFPIAKFIRDVWQLNLADLELEDDTTFAINTKDYIRYHGSTYAKSGTNQPEGDAAIALEKIWLDLASQLPAADGHTPMFFFNMMDRTVRGTYAKYKPDFGCSPIQGISMQRWEYLVDCGELKKRYARVKQSADTFHLRISAEDIKRVFETKDKRKRGKQDDDDAEYAPPKRVKTAREVPSGSSTSSTLPAADWNDDAPELTGHELQIAKYLNELLSHGARTYATGFLLEETKMSLWYADRMGLVKSELFDIFEQPQYFLLVVAAHHYGDAHHFGFHPFLSVNNAEHLVQYQDVILTLPVATSAALPPIDAPADLTSAFDEGTGSAVQFAEFQVNLDEGRQVHTAYGTVGRGTTVIPVLAGPRAAAQFDIANVRLVAKLASPLESRPAEDKFIRIIRRKLNGDDRARQFLKHIVDLKCSFNGKMDDERMGFPRAKMSPVPEASRRCFRILVMPEYLPLERIDNRDELKQVFVDVVTGHHWVWETSHILHRDISYGNIMFYRESNVDGEQKIVGVLTDWDLAEEQEGDGAEVNDSERLRPVGAVPSALDSDEQPQQPEEEGADSTHRQEAQKRQKAKYRTGTGPFMAYELLSYHPPPAHLYRHDLESFFWVLAWFCAVFNPDLHTVGFIPGWHQNRLQDIGTEKAKFLASYAEIERVCANTHATYMPFITTWIKYLRHILNNARNASIMEKEQREGYYELLDGTEDNVPMRPKLVAYARKKLLQAREELRDMVTYDVFMEVFAIPVRAL